MSRLEPAKTIKLSLISGLLLVASLFAAYFAINSSLFTTLWSAHMLVQATATLGALVFILKLDTSFPAATLKIVYLIFLVLIALNSVVPVTSRDALLYHLAVPKYWLQAGKITELAWNEWSYFPLLMSVGYAGFLQFGLETLTPLYHLSFLILLSAICAALVLSKTKNSFPALFAGLLPVSTPLYIRLAAEPMADICATFYFGLFFYLCYLIIEDPKKNALQFMAGIALGLCLSVKYNTFLAIAILFPLLIASYKSSHSNLKFLAGIACRISLPCILIGLFWPLKNFLWTGNPFFPFLDSFFSGSSANVAFTGGIAPFIYRRDVYHESILDFVLIPFRMFLFGMDNIPQQFDGVISPFYLLALVAFFIPVLRKDILIKHSFLFVVAFFTFAMFLFYALARYYLPAILLLGIIVCLLLNYFYEKRNKKLNFYITILISLHCLWGFAYWYKLTAKLQTFAFIKGEITKEQYLTRHIPEYSLIQYINKNLPHEANIYLLFTGNKYYYYDLKPRGGYFSGDLIRDWVKEVQSPDELASKFHTENISYLLLHPRRTDDVFLASFTATELVRWHAFLKEHTTPLAGDGFYSLLKLK